MRDEPILINDFSILGMGYPLCYKDHPIDLTRSEVEVCWTLMKAFPSMVKPATILTRIGSDGEPNTLSVLIYRIRDKFKARGIPCPIATVRGYGYHWVVI